MTISPSGSQYEALYSRAHGASTVDRDRLFLDAAGCCSMWRPAQDALINSVIEANKIGPNHYSATQNIPAKFKETVAGLIGYNPENISHGNQATGLTALALQSVPFQRGDVILVDQDVYGSTWAVCNQYLRKHRKVKVQVIPNDEKGQLSCMALRNIATD